MRGTGREGVVCIWALGHMGSHVAELTVGPLCCGDAHLHVVMLVADASTSA